MEAIAELIKEFGFPIAVAIWALWQLKTTWQKNSEFQIVLNECTESLHDIKEILDKNAQIQTEMLTTLKILHALLTRNGGVDK